ncbi:MAG: hypothetical protein ACYCPT_13230 [Acidimicrobiales bacterium]
MSIGNIKMVWIYFNDDYAIDLNEECDRAHNHKVIRCIDSTIEFYVIELNKDEKFDVVSNTNNIENIWSIIADMIKKDTGEVITIINNALNLVINRLDGSMSLQDDANIIIALAAEVFEINIAVQRNNRVQYWGVDDEDPVQLNIIII